ncbi:MAG: TSUP family transporter [Amylibacter sp.]
MPFDIIIALIAVAIGAILQVGIGIGFSIVAGPILMLQLGTPMAVPLLLLLNTTVSVVASPGSMARKDHKIIALSSIGCLIGIGLGILVYRYLSEVSVLAITGTLLLIGVLATLVPMRTISQKVFMPISGLSGLATVWAATPGPLMALGFMLSGYSAAQVRKMIQPVALVAYGTAFLLHAVTDWDRITQYPDLLALLLASIIGSLIGRWVGPFLPQALIINGIRIISLFAGLVLFYRAATLL